MEMFFQSNFLLEKPHRYYLFSSGTDMSSRVYDTRCEAEQAMYDFCELNHIHGLECTEYDKHERKYSNHNGVRFYINRI